MKAFGCQLDIVWENKPANFKKVRSLLAQGSVPRGSLFVLPEMFATGFSMNLPAVREGIPSETEQFLESLAQEHGIYVLGGVVGEGADGQFRNQAVVFSPEGRLLCRYSKIHPFTLGGEADCYTAGKEVLTFEWEGCVVAPFICYDLRFPEIFRAAVRQGAQLFVVIADWPIKRDRHWVTLLQARAIENQVYVVGVNRCGTDPKFVYSGRSLVVDHHGAIHTELVNEEGLVSLEIDLTALLAWRAEFPVLRDMHWAGEAELV